MKSIGKFVGVLAAAFVATTSVAFAAGGPFNVPEPSSLALVGVAVAVLVAVRSKRK